MKKQFIIIAAVIGLLASCPNSGNKPVDPEKPAQKTFIVFDNTQGICAVSVYDDYRRRDEDKIAEISAGNNSGKIACTPGESVPFYFSYRVTIKGINEFSLSYIPEIGRDQKQVRIDADVTTNIKIPTLSETFSSPDKLLSNNSYLLIQNNSSYSFQLHRGSSILSPDNASAALVNSGERAQYTINPGPVSPYQLLVGADYKEFPLSIVNFEAGHIYYFEFNGSISLVRDTELKLVNVNGIAIPQSPAAPVVIVSNGSLALRWAAVESATAYEIWLSTVNDSASASKYGTDIVASLTATINGLNNRTAYYIWLKAKNYLGTSNFSPVATGIPSASTVKPPDPQTAPSIIAGNGQLSVSWQAVEDASVYEIWAGTTNDTQTATKRGGDVSGLSAIITGLNNGTTYYVCIKAKNNIGISGFSPPATGKPLGTPATPTLNSGLGQLLVTWTTVAGADEYEVYYGIDMPTTLAVTTTVTTTTITGLTNGTTYNVRLLAKNAGGISDYGPSASGVPGVSPGLYRGIEKIGSQNLTDSLTYISSNAVSGDEYYIVLGIDESISPKTISNSNRTMRITLLGYGGERIITLNANGSMFTVSADVILTLDENVTLVGRSTNNASLVYISGGNLIMNNGAKITGNTNTTSYSNGGGVYVVSGTFIMNGGIISGNTAYGGGISVSGGTFTMNGGTISGNTTNNVGGGGGIDISSSGIVTMNDGTISGNTTKTGGGGINISSGTITMNGGRISSNTANGGGGGGINFHGGGIVIMNGGIINGNSASNSGGAIFFGSGIFKKIPSSDSKNSGIIYGSEAVGVDSDGIPLKNTGPGSAVDSSSLRRSTTAWETDQIDTTTGKGLSVNGNPPYEQ
jgi:hypothetical protein